MDRIDADQYRIRLSRSDRADLTLEVSGLGDGIAGL
jgi:hypothetical protein